MTTKWRILGQPLQVHLKNVGKYLCALQGCITFALMNVVFVSAFKKTILKMKLDLFHLMNISENYVLRDIIVQDLAQRALERPTFNKLFWIN